MKTQFMKFFILTAITSLMFVACQSNQSSNSASQEQPGVHKVVVKEVIQTSNYTYLLVTEKDAETWLALPLMEAKAGDTYYYTGGFEMTDFESKELGRIFKSVYFLESVSTSPDELTADPVNFAHSKGSVTTEKKHVDVQPAPGGITIAELFANKDSYAGKTVRIRGQVTKFNAAIMKMNWIHLQDGTDNSGKYDLTATTDIEAEVGDVITLEGTVALNKDFGYGYAYEILLENAVLIGE
jgi:hypothetical protein